MGENVYSIYGELRLDRFAATQPKTLGLLRRRVRSRTSLLDDGTRITTFPARSFAPLLEDFRQFLRDRAPCPWNATVKVYDYLRRATVGVAAEQCGDFAPQPSIDVHLPDSDGVAEVSACVAWHWLDLWYRSEHERLAAELLEPYGFTPGGTFDDCVETRTFLPTPSLGYVLYLPLPLDRPLYERFRLDGAARDELKQSVNAAFVRVLNDEFAVLDERFTRLMDDSLCRCQLCMPGFDLSAFVA